MSRQKWTSLLSAARCGDITCYHELLARGASLEERDGWSGWTPLFRAAWEGRRSIVRLFLRHGAKINNIVPGKATPLVAASQRGHADVVRELLDSGATIDAAMKDGTLPCGSRARAATTRLLWSCWSAARTSELV